MNKAIHKLSTMPADEFLTGVCELFEQRLDRAGDGSRNGPADIKQKACVDCSRPTRVRRCPRCWQRYQYEINARRKQRKKVQTNGASFHVARVLVEEPL